MCVYIYVCVCVVCVCMCVCVRMKSNRTTNTHMCDCMPTYIFPPRLPFLQLHEPCHCSG